MQPKSTKFRRRLTGKEAIIFAAYRRKCPSIARHVVAFSVGFTACKLVTETLKKKVKSIVKWSLCLVKRHAIKMNLEWRYGFRHSVHRCWMGVVSFTSLRGKKPQ
jgi:hypothetical protein